MCIDVAVQAAFLQEKFVSGEVSTIAVMLLTVGRLQITKALHAVNKTV